MNQQRVFIFEWVCGGGLFADRIAPETNLDLLSQGWQMLVDVCDDFVENGYLVETLIDNRLELTELSPSVKTHRFENRNSSLPARLLELAGACQWILIVAPETNGRLEQCLTKLLPLQSRLLNPSISLTKLASNKHELAHFLKSKNVLVPDGDLLSNLKSFGIRDLEYPMVIKPVDGCGGEGIRLVHQQSDFEHVDDPASYRLEEFVAGEAVSVSVTLGESPEIYRPLRQTFRTLPIGKFKNCKDDLTDSIADRAIRLAEKTIEALPQSNGYVGIDMVIGKQDVVIEINPRLTMSYGLLRKANDQSSLADQMVESCRNGIRHRRTNPAPSA